MTAPENQIVNSSEIIAVVSKGRNGHFRKNKNSELWTELSVGDSLYFHDTIRTSSNESLFISFLGKNQNVEIEPDSLLVLQENEGKISLDVLEGHLLVQKNQSQNTLTEDSLSVNLNGYNSDVAKNKIMLTSPIPEQELFTSNSNKKHIHFQWSQSSNVKSELWLGSSRKTLRKVTEGAETDFTLELPTGLYFWFVKSPTIKQQSEVQKFKITEKVLPLPIYPAHQAFIKSKNNLEKIQFTWQNLGAFSKTVLEVFQDIDLNQKIIEESFITESSFTASELPEGTYYWRLKVFNDLSNETYTTRLNQFTIAEKIKINVPMSWTTGTETYQHFLGDQPIINISWTEVKHPAFKTYKIKIASNENEINQSSFEIAKENRFFKKLKTPGRYIASIEALDDEGERVAYLPPRSFDVQPLPLIPAIKVKSKEKFLQSDDYGNLQVEWDACDKAYSYKYSLQNLKGITIKEDLIKENFLALNDLLPGSYKLNIVGIDKYNREGEKSKSVTIYVPEVTSMGVPKILKKEVDE